MIYTVNLPCTARSVKQRFAGKPWSNGSLTWVADEYNQFDTPENAIDVHDIRKFGRTCTIAQLIFMCHL